MADLVNLAQLGSSSKKSGKKNVKTYEVGDTSKYDKLKPNIEELMKECNFDGMEEMGGEKNELWLYLIYLYFYHDI